MAVQLVGKHIDSTVNNPIEAESHWRAGKLRPLCVMDKTPMPYTTKLTDNQSWADVPTCASQGVPVDYLMLRGIFMPPGVTPDQVEFYVDLFKKIRSAARVEGLHGKGRLQADHHERPGVCRLARQERAAAPRADEGSGLPGQVSAGGDDLTGGRRHARRPAESP